MKKYQLKEQFLEKNNSVKLGNTEQEFGTI
jgi:hypothetical protein